MESCSKNNNDNKQQQQQAEPNVTIKPEPYCSTGPLQDLDPQGDVIFRGYHFKEND